MYMVISPTVERLYCKQEANPMSGVFQNIEPPPPPPPGECMNPPHQRRGRTHSLGGEGGGGSIFWKTPDTALYSTSASTLWVPRITEKEVRKTEILFVGVGSSFSLPLLVLQVDRYWPLNNFNRTCHLFLKDLSCAALVNLFYDFLQKTRPMLLTFFYCKSLERLYCVLNLSARKWYIFEIRVVFLIKNITRLTTQAYMENAKDFGKCKRRVLTLLNIGRVLTRD